MEKKMADKRLSADAKSELSEYRSYVNQVHQKFEELKDLTSSRNMPETYFLLSVAYKSFTDNIFADIKNNPFI